MSAKLLNHRETLINVVQKFFFSGYKGKKLSEDEKDILTKAKESLKQFGTYGMMYVSIAEEILSA
jgi:hypothetical protein